MKRTKQKEQTYDRLLDMAYNAFERNGFLATKTVDISTAAGVSHGALFVHFNTKDELLVKVIDSFGLRIGKKFQQLMVDKKSAREVLAAHLSAIGEFEPFYAHLVIEGPLLPSALRNRILMIQSGVAHYLEKSMQGSKNSYPIYFLLNSWLGLIHYYLTNRDIFAPGESVIAKCGQDLLDHFTKTFNL